MDARIPGWSTLQAVDMKMEKSYEFSKLVAADRTRRGIIRYSAAQFKEIDGIR
jgi:hypothetical protein